MCIVYLSGKLLYIFAPQTHTQSMNPLKLPELVYNKDRRLQKLAHLRRSIDWEYLQVVITQQ